MAKTIKMDKNGRPKRVAGLKIPKHLRGTAGLVIDKVNTPEGRALIGKGVGAVMAFAMAARAQAAHAPAPKPSPAPKPPVPPATADAPPAPPPHPTDGPTRPGMGGTTAAPDVEKMVEAIGVAADAVFKRVFGGKPAG